MIQSHLYARKNGTLVYADPFEDGRPLHELKPGDWTGVIEYRDSWIRVIGVDCDGWVKEENLERRPPLQLHACWTDGSFISYTNAGVNETAEVWPEKNIL